jgi:ribosome-associated toxin RatA of RatAB toxin-antitoxin module
MVRINQVGLGLVCLLFLSGMLPVTAGALQGLAPEDWTFSRRLGDVDIYRQPINGSRFPAVRAHARINASAKALYAVISDYEHFRDFIPSVLDSRVLARQMSTLSVYQRLGFPLMVADRHYVIQVTENLVQAGEGLLRVTWQLDRQQSLSLTSGSAVVPDAFSGSWRLAELEQGRATDATYSIHVEPGGRLPAWLLLSASERYVFQVIQAVRRRLSGGE